jgi:hypothetical protein
MTRTAVDVYQRVAPSVRSSKRSSVICWRITKEKGRYPMSDPEIDIARGPDPSPVKVIETPHGTITLLPITEEGMEKLKKMMLGDPDLDLDLTKPCDNPVGSPSR